MMPADTDSVELRGDVPRAAYDVFDAVSKARGYTKQALLARIVSEWAAREVHVANVIQRMTRGKGVESLPDWEGNGD
jgi:hypothetical protein